MGALIATRCLARDLAAIRTRYVPLLRRQGGRVVLPSDEQLHVRPYGFRRRCELSLRGQHGMIIRMQQATTPEEAPPAEYELPRAIKLARPGWGGASRRAVATTSILGRELGTAFARRLLRRHETTDHAPAAAVRRAFAQLGATYVKFGQFVGSAPDIVGDAVAAEFRGFLDAGPSVPFDEVRTIIERELDMPLAAAFATFDQRPYAAASLAVVHRATLPDGQPVAVKVLRPGMERVVSADLALMTKPVEFLGAQGSDTAMLLLEYLIGLREQVAEELDLRNEARSMAYFRGLFERLGLDRLVVPRVYESHSSARVVTMEFIDGVPIDNLASIDEFGLDPRPVVRQLMQAWILTAALHGVFHADIHAGNLHLQRDGRLAMLDWGIVARMDPDTHILLELLLQATLGAEGCWENLSAHVVKSRPDMSETLGLNDEQITRMVRAMMEPVLTEPVGQIRMSSLFASSDEAMAMATGEAAPPKRSLAEQWKALRRRRAHNRSRIRLGALDVELQRSTFLAAKQLVYLEHYWKMYLPEEPLLGDHDFIRSVLDERRSRAVES